MQWVPDLFAEVGAAGRWRLPSSPFGVVVTENSTVLRGLLFGELYLSKRTLVPEQTRHKTLRQGTGRRAH